MFNFFFEERRKQLQTQSKIDDILHTLKHTCSDTVSDYLLFQREYTRNQQFKVINSSLWNLKNEISNQLQKTTKLENIFFQNLNPFPTCEKLKETIFLSSQNIND